MTKILFVYNKEMVSFIQKDLNTLEKHFQVRVVRYSGITDLLKIFRGILWSNIVFSWFASLHSFYVVISSKIVGRKSIIVAGGYDVAFCPGIKYGSIFYWWKRWCSILTLKFATLILTISKANTQEAIENAKANRSKIKLVYLGFDFDYYKPNSNVKKESVVLTVGAVSRSNLLRKGLEVFVKSARLLPDFKFILAGKWADDSVDHLKSVAPPNVCFLNNLDDTALLDVFRKSKVYVQASYHEAFGCSLAEAMLCECIPVVTEVAALPEVVGDWGFFLLEQSPEKLAVLIKKALNSDPELGERARQRIKMVFPLEKREKDLLQIVEQLMFQKRKIV